MKRIRLALSIVATLIVLALPASASANVADSFTGWGTVAPATAGSTTAPAWKWYSWYGWWGTSRSANSRVWIQPFAAGWSWTWGGDRGWLAMRTSDLGSGSTTPTPTTETGARGTVDIGLTCPFAPCTQWIPPIDLTFTWDDAANGNATTDVKTRTVTTTAGTGAYTVKLKPGTYKVSTSLDVAWSSSVVVPASGYVTRNFTIDVF